MFEASGHGSRGDRRPHRAGARAAALDASGYVDSLAGCIWDIDHRAVAISEPLRVYPRFAGQRYVKFRFRMAPSGDGLVYANSHWYQGHVDSAGRWFTDVTSTGVPYHFVDLTTGAASMQVRANIPLPSPYGARPIMEVMWWNGAQYSSLVAFAIPWSLGQPVQSFCF